MKILMFNYEYPPLGGGGGVVHQEIAQELALRHDVRVVTSGFRGLPDTEAAGGVTVHRVRVAGRKSLPTASLLSMLSYWPASLRKGEEVIRAWRPDVINTHFAVPSGPSAVTLARRHRIPHVLTVHGGDLYDPSKALSPHRVPGLRHTVRWVLNHVDCVIAQSANTAANARRIYRCARPIEIIPLGLEPPETSPVPRSFLELSDDQVVLVTVGRLVRRKANHQLVEVLARLNEPRAILVIVGDGPERPRIEATARRLGVSDRVRLTGFIGESEKFRYLRAADIFVSTTLHEGFGLMFIEAMFCGLPVVSYAHGGHTDFLEDGKSGYLVPVNDRDLFRTRLEELIDSPARREGMGRHNFEASKAYTRASCARRYERVLESASGIEHAAGAAKPTPLFPSDI